MHEVTPKEVATAVRMVITMFRILLQSSFLFMVDGCLRVMICFFMVVIQTTVGRKDLGCIAQLCSNGCYRDPSLPLRMT